MNDYDPLDIETQQLDKLVAERREKHYAAIEAADFAWLMQHPQGRRFVWRLMERAGLYRTTFTGDSTTFYREGIRSFGILLMQLINDHCPDQYMPMVNDGKSRDHYE